MELDAKELMSLRYCDCVMGEHECDEVAEQTTLPVGGYIPTGVDTGCPHGRADLHECRECEQDCPRDHDAEYKDSKL